jgi:hypothetical protein
VRSGTLQIPTDFLPETSISSEPRKTMAWRICEAIRKPAFDDGAAEILLSGGRRGISPPPRTPVRSAVAGVPRCHSLCSLSPRMGALGYPSNPKSLHTRIKDSEPKLESLILVGGGGFEPPHPCGHKYLKLTCLPVPPSAHSTSLFRLRHRQLPPYVAQCLYTAAAPWLSVPKLLREIQWNL